MSALASQMVLAGVVLVVLTMHAIPDLALVTRGGDLVPYDARLNFVSELARTEWGAVMTGCFVAMGVAVVLAARGLDAARLRPVAFAMLGMAALCGLLALFPTDLNDFRYASTACDEVDRIEPCTWVGRVHDVLPALFVPLAAFVGLAFLRRGGSWRRVGWAGVGALVVAVALAVLAFVYVRHTVDVTRPFVGLMQRAVIVPALGWLAFVNHHVARGT